MAVKSGTVERYFLLVLGVIALVWLRSGIGKAMGGTFVATLPKALVAFVSKNPYPWFKDFLANTVMPNSQVWGTLTILGELFAGGAILLGALIIGKKGTALARWLLGLGLLVGAFLNLIFLLAAGWTSPSTESLNILMLVIEIMGLGFAAGIRLGA